MLDKTTLIATVCERLPRLETGHCLDLRTYKRNRSVAIVRTGADSFDVFEAGFHEETWTGVTADAVRRLLKTLLKWEFPRSHKVRLYTLPSREAANVNRRGHGAGRFGED